MSSPHQRPRRRFDNPLAVIGYILGIVGTGALIATLLILFQFDTRQQQRDTQVSELQGKLASVQTELGQQKQDYALLSDRFAEISTGNVSDPNAGTHQLASSPGGQVEDGQVEDGQSLAAVHQELQSSQARLADLEARTRNFEQLETQARQVAQQVAELRQQLATVEQAGENYAKLTADFAAQSKQLLATNEELRLLKQQISERRSTPSVSRSNTTISPPGQVTVTRVPATVRTTALPPLTSFPPAEGTVVRRYVTPSSSSSWYPSSYSAGSADAGYRTYSNVTPYPSSGSYYWP
ncbi:MAG: hypothetical protein J5I93_11855 [Pirellulaceae bacterium]|nr:hypothetical protein [Pirellulaceae bacterium]